MSLEQMPIMTNAERVVVFRNLSDRIMKLELENAQLKDENEKLKNKKVIVMPYEFKELNYVSN